MRESLDHCAGRRSTSQVSRSSRISDVAMQESGTRGEKNFRRRSRRREGAHERRDARRRGARAVASQRRRRVTISLQRGEKSQSVFSWARRSAMRAATDARGDTASSSVRGRHRRDARENFLRRIVDSAKTRV
jgi:hypothetical protein